MHPRVNHRLHDQQHVGRSGAAKRGRHVQVALVVDLDSLVQRAQYGLRLLKLLLRDPARGLPHRNPFRNLARCVGHRADYRGVAQGLDDLLHWDAGGD